MYFWWVSQFSPVKLAFLVGFRVGKSVFASSFKEFWGGIWRGYMMTNE